MSWMPLVVSEGCWIVLKVYWMSMNVTESFWRLLEGILNQRPLLCSIITGGCWKLQVVLGRLEDHFRIFHIWCKKPRLKWRNLTQRAVALCVNLCPASRMETWRNINLVLVVWGLGIPKNNLIQRAHIRDIGIHSGLEQLLGWTKYIGAGTYIFGKSIA